MKKRKTAAIVGSVLRPIRDQVALRPWAEFAASEHPWKERGHTVDQIVSEWGSESRRWRFYSAADPKAPGGGFDNEYGLIIFCASGGRAVAEEMYKASLPAELGDGGFVLGIATKEGHKNSNKFLLSAAERVVSESLSFVYAVVAASDQQAARLYRAQGYDEAAQNGSEIVFVKKLGE